MNSPPDTQKKDGEKESEDLIHLLSGHDYRVTGLNKHGRPKDSIVLLPFVIYSHFSGAL